MIIEKLATKTGLRITFDSVFTLKSEDNFSILQENIFFSFNQAIIDNKTIELYFTNDPLLPPEEQLVFDKNKIFRLSVTTQNYNSSFDYVYELLNVAGSNVIVTTPGVNVPIFAELDFDFDVVKDENEIPFLLLDYIDDGTLLDSFFNITIKEFKLHQYSDFPFKTYSVKKIIEPEHSLQFAFKKDFLYEVTVSFVPAIGVEFTSLKKTKTLIPFMPTKYFTTAYQIKNLLAELELEINLFNGIDSQLQIWKHSELAFNKCGILLSTLGLLDDSEFMVLSNYVSYKIILQKYMSCFLNMTLEQSDKDSNQGAKGLKLGDFSVTAISTPQETINSLNTLIRSLENELKDISTRRASTSVNRLVSQETRNSLLYPNKKSIVNVKYKNGSKYFGTWW